MDQLIVIVLLNPVIITCATSVGTIWVIKPRIKDIHQNCTGERHELPASVREKELTPIKRPSIRC